MMPITKIPVGKLILMTNGREDQNLLVDENNNTWVPKGMCTICSGQVLRLLQSNSMASLIEEAENHLMWKSHNTACNGCNIKLVLISTKWEIYLLT